MNFNRACKFWRGERAAQVETAERKEIRTMSFNARSRFLTMAICMPRMISYRKVCFFPAYFRPSLRKRFRFDWRICFVLSQFSETETKWDQAKLASFLLARTGSQSRRCFKLTANQVALNQVDRFGVPRKISVMAIDNCGFRFT